MKKQIKKQIILIHGGNTYDSYREYIASLKKRKLNFDRLRMKGWKKTIGDKLGDNFEVIAPSMPNSENARYLEWKIWFEKIIPHMNREVVLVGHSLGGIFLAKYLFENRFHKKIRCIFLVAPPFNTRRKGETLADFKLPKNFKIVGEYANRINLYFSMDDPLVPFSNMDMYIKAIPNANKHIFKNRGHFSDDKFPELVKDIKALYK